MAVQYLDPVTGDSLNMPYVPPVASTPYTPPPPPAPIITGQQASNTGGSSSSAPPGMSQAEWDQVIRNDPFLKQQLEWNQEDFNTAMRRAQEDAAYAARAYQMNVQQANLSRPTGGSTIGAGEQYMKQLDALEKEKASRAYAQGIEQIREIMASRGLRDSGQYGFELDEADYQYNTLKKEIDIRAQARAAEIAAARAREAQANARANQQINLRLQEMQMQYEQTKLGYTRYEEDLRSNLAKANGQAYLQTWDRLEARYWDGEKYVGPGSTTESASAQPAAPPAPAPAPAYSAPVQTGTNQPGPLQPGVNPIMYFK